jgi:hypothetical protein
MAGEKRLNHGFYGLLDDTECRGGVAYTGRGTDLTDYEITLKNAPLSNEGKSTLRYTLRSTLSSVSSNNPSNP